MDIYRVSHLAAFLFNNNATEVTHDDQRRVVKTVLSIDIDAPGYELLACSQVAPPTGVQKGGKFSRVIERVLVTKDPPLDHLVLVLEFRLQLVLFEDVGHLYRLDCTWKKK